MNENERIWASAKIAGKAGRISLVPLFIHSLSSFQFQMARAIFSYFRGMEKFSAGKIGSGLYFTKKKLEETMGVWLFDKTIFATNPLSATQIRSWATFLLY